MVGGLGLVGALLLPLAQLLNQRKKKKYKNCYLELPGAIEQNSLWNLRVMFSPGKTLKKYTSSVVSRWEGERFDLPNFRFEFWPLKSYLCSFPLPCEIMLQSCYYFLITNFAKFSKFQKLLWCIRKPKEYFICLYLH